MRSPLPCSDSSATPSSPSQLEWIISSKPQLLILSTRPCTTYTTLPTYSITLLLTEHTPDIPLPVPKTGHFSFSPLGLHMGASQVALMVKNLPASAGDLRDMGLIPESGRSPGGGNGIRNKGIQLWAACVDVRGRSCKEGSPSHEALPAGQREPVYLHHSFQKQLVSHQRARSGRRSPGT